MVELLIFAVIALVVLIVVWKIFKGLVRTFGLLIVLIAVAVFVYFNGAP